MFATKQKVRNQTHKQLILFNLKSLKMGQRSKWTFLPNGHPGGHKVHEKMLTSLVIRETPIKTRTGHLLKPVRMAFVKKSTDNK